ncbi:MAG: DUF1573 domain-containing protein [Bacteroidia bacterium]|jgi:hypothetical protein|nr:DUF1573 domain-containing protein [Bacteroidia bacterium]
MIINFIRRIIILGMVIFASQTTRAQEEIEYNDELKGNQVEYVEMEDRYGKEAFQVWETVSINFNDLTGMTELVLGEKYEALIYLPNIGIRDVFIRGFSNPCLCIQTDWHKTPIAPGATGFVKIKYTASIIGPHQKQFKAYLFDSVTLKPVAKVNIIIHANVAGPTDATKN